MIKKLNDPLHASLLLSLHLIGLTIVMSISRTEKIFFSALMVYTVQHLDDERTGEDTWSSLRPPHLNFPLHSCHLLLISYFTPLLCLSHTSHTRCMHSSSSLSCHLLHALLLLLHALLPLLLRLLSHTSLLHAIFFFFFFNFLSNLRRL